MREVKTITVQSNRLELEYLSARMTCAKWYTFMALVPAGKCAMYTGMRVTFRLMLPQPSNVKYTSAHTYRIECIIFAVLCTHFIMLAVSEILYSTLDASHLIHELACSADVTRQIFGDFAVGQEFAGRERLEHSEHRVGERQERSHGPSDVRYSRDRTQRHEEVHF